jgi:hypothetical protein
MADLRDLLRQADRLPAPDLWPDIEGRRPARTPHGGHRLAAGVVALALAASGIALVSTAFFGTRESPRTPGAPLVALDPTITAEIDVGQFPSEIAAGYGAVWATVNQADPAERWYVARIDPRTNEVTVETDIHKAVDVVAAAGSVWVAGVDLDSGSAVFRLDPSTGGIETIVSLGCFRECYPSQIAADENAVWVTVSAEYPEWGEVIRIDTLTNRVAGRTRIPGDPRDLVIGQGSVWVYSLTHFTKQSVAGGTIYRLDPATGEVVATLLEGRIPPASGVNGPPVLAAGFGYVWTSVAPGKPIALGDDETSIVRIDPSTNEVIGDRIPLGTLFFPFSVEEGGVWFRGGEEDAEPLAGRLDPTTQTIEDTFPVDGTVLDGAIDPETHTMWLTTYEGSVLRVDLR